jgi:hypothetical protein
MTRPDVLRSSGSADPAVRTLPEGSVAGHRQCVDGGAQLSIARMQVSGGQPANSAVDIVSTWRGLLH